MRLAFVALLLLPQIFTEAIVPDAQGRCLVVVYKETAYIAATATRTRLTGRVVLKMPDRVSSPVIPRTEVARCAAQCLSSVASTNPCVMKCWTGPEAERLACAHTCDSRASEPRRPFLERLGDGSRSDRRPIVGPMELCENQCLSTIPLEAPTTLPGREIQLAGADVITSGECSCQGAKKCVSR